MTSEFACNKFKELIKNIDYMDLKLWIDTTYPYIEDYFKFTSIQARNFNSLITDVNIYYSGFPFLKDRNKELVFKERAVGYLKSYIKYIEEHEIEEKKAQKILSDSLKIQFKDKPQQNEPTKEIQKSKLKPSDKSFITFNISKEFFWIISSSILVAAFFLGLYFGQTKFDKEKIEYYEQSKDLKQEVSDYKFKIDSLTNLSRELILKNKNLEEK